MSNILLIGKDLPDGNAFAEALAGSENTVFTSAKSENEGVNFESEKIFATKWNKSSAISAHSLLINAETKLGQINHVVFYFDTTYFVTKFELDKTEEVSVAIDTMVNPFLYASGELIKRADQKKEKLTVSFLVKNYPSKCEVTLNSSKNPGILPASIIVSTAEAAFTSLAENFASYVKDRDYLSVILGKCNSANELYKSEKNLAQWLNDAYVSVNTAKVKQNGKHACTWNKAGAKISTGFSLFK